MKDSDHTKLHYSDLDWKEPNNKITICDQKLPHSPYIDYGRGKVVDCESFGMLYALMLAEQETQPSKSRKEEPDLGQTTTIGYMLGWQDGGRVKGEITPVAAIGLDVDENHPPEIEELVGRCRWNAFAHESRNSQPGDRRYHLFVELSRPLRSREERKVVLQHVIDQIGGHANASNSPANKVWSAIPPNVGYYATDMQPPLDVDSLTFMIPQREGKKQEPAQPRPKPDGEIDQTAIEEQVVDWLREAKHKIDNLEPNNRHSGLVKIVPLFAGRLFGAIEAGYETDPEVWRSALAEVIFDFLEGTRNPDAQKQQERVEDYQRLLADQWKWGEEKPIEFNPPIRDDEPEADNNSDDLYLPFPMEALPPKLRNVAYLLAKRRQVPIEMAAHSVLAATSISTQHLADVECPDFSTPLGDYFMVLASTGERKSAVMKDCDGFLKKIQQEKRDAARQSKLDYLFEKEAYDAEVKRIMRNKEGLDPKGIAKKRKDLGEPPEPPVSGDVTVNDPTIEALVQLLENSPQSVAWTLNEATRFLKGRQMTSENKLYVTSILNDLWDAENIDVRRTGRETKPVSDKRFGLFWYCQPRVAAEFINDIEVKDQGLLPRMLLVVARDKKGYRDARFGQHSSEIVAEAKRAIDAFQRRLAHLFALPAREREGCPNTLDPPLLTLSEAAEEAYWEEQERLEPMKRPQERYGQIGGFADKLMTHALRLAGAMTLYEDESATEIDRDTFSRAVALAHYFAEVWLRVGTIIPANTEGKQWKDFVDWLTTRCKRNEINYSYICKTGPLRGESVAPIARQRYWDEALRAGYLEELKEHQQKTMPNRQKTTHRIARK